MNVVLAAASPLSAREKQVFIAPVSREHINEDIISDEIRKKAKELVSIEGLIPIGLVSDTLSDENKRRLQEIFPDGKIRIWGTFAIPK